MRTSEQADLASAVRALLTKHADSAAVRAAMTSDAGYDVALWAKLSEQIGVAALAIPDEFGGVGGTIADTAVVLEELGYSLAPAPLLASVISSEALLGADPPDAELLSRIAAGAIATVVTEGVGVSDDQLTGSARHVPHGDQAEILVVDAGGSLYDVNPELATGEYTPAMDPTLRLATVALAGVPGRRLTGDSRSARARARSAALIGASALAVGCAQRGLDMTVAYAKERTQFGRPIGSFQALKHRMADMLVLVEMARSAAWAAAAGELDPSTAAAYCVDAAHRVAAETIQLHGGIAITWEHDAHLVFKRAHALSHLVGQPHRLRASLDLG